MRLDCGEGRGELGLDSGTGREARDGFGFSLDDNDDDDDDGVNGRRVNVPLVSGSSYSTVTHTVDGLNVRCGGREAFSARLPMQGATNVSDQRRRSRPTDSADGLTGLRHR